VEKGDEYFNSLIVIRSKVKKAFCWLMKLSNDVGKRYEIEVTK